MTRLVDRRAASQIDQLVRHAYVEPIPWPQNSVCNQVRERGRQDVARRAVERLS